MENKDKQENKIEEKEPEEIKGKSSVSMDSLTQDENMPAVQEHAISAVMSKKAEDQEANGFDPKIHAVDNEGKPKLTKAGKFQKKRGRKVGNSKLGIKKEETQPEKPEISSLETATVISGVLEQVSTKLISDEWQLNEVERATNIKAWESTLDHYGGVTMSPPTMLMLSHMQIIMSRVPQPETKSKLKLIGAWWANKKAKWKGKKLNARTDSRKNDVGENDIRKEESA